MLAKLQFVFTCVCFLLTIVVGIVSYQWFSTLQRSMKTARTTTSVSDGQQEICPRSCVTACEERIRVEVASLSGQIAALPHSSVVQQTTVTKTVKAGSVKEFFIPLGSASTESNDWVDVPGAETSFDPKNYNTIGSVQFEASMRIPVGNGTVYARLYNVTEKHPVWNSEVAAETSTSTLKTSSAMSMSTGNAVYRMQIKTSLYPAFIDFARIRIVVK